MNIPYVFSNCALPMLICAVLSYLLGSINFAIIISKCFGLGDIREKGSGNAGATNMLRSAGKIPALLTTLGDLLKAVAALVFTRWLFNVWGLPSFVRCASYVAALCCVLGHLYPLYFGFHGGKGILASLGVMLVLDWRVALISLGVFIIVAAIWKYVSLGSICAAITMILSTFILLFFVDLPRDQYLTVTRAVFCCLIATVIGILLIVKHRTNIKRLLSGTESKLSFKSKKEEG